MIYIWAVVIAALLFISVLVAFRVGQMRGYKEGALQVLKEWKKYMDMEEENNG